MLKSVTTPTLPSPLPNPLLVIPTPFLRHSREGGERSDRQVNPSPELEFITRACVVRQEWVMDSRLRGNDEVCVIEREWCEAMAYSKITVTPCLTWPVLSEVEGG